MNISKGAGFGIRGLTTIFGLAFVGVLAFGAWTQVGPRHEASASLLLLPGSHDVAEGANPFLYLGNLSQLRDVMIKIANSETTRSDLIDPSSGADYVIGWEYTTSAPLLTVDVTATTSTEALSLRDSLLEFLPRELQQVQDRAKAPADSRISALVLASDKETNVNIKGPLRATLAAVAMGLGITFVVLMGVNRLMRRRNDGTGPSDEEDASWDPSDGIGTSGDESDHGRPTEPSTAPTARQWVEPPDGDRTVGVDPKSPAASLQ